MSTTTVHSAPVVIDDRGTTERLILESELRRLDAQLLANGRILASGTDPKAKPDHLMKQRERVIQALDKLRTPATPPSHATAVQVPPLLGSLLTAPIAPGRITTTGLGPWFGGYAGSVQMGITVELQNLWPKANYNGNLYTEYVSLAGGIQYTGDCDAQALPENPDSPPFKWLMNWRNLVPFPAPPAESWFTYSFDVDVQYSIASMDGTGNIAAYVFIGETSKPGEYPPPATVQAASPLVYHVQGASEAVLKQTVTVRRTALVAAGEIPVVALALYIACNLDPHTDVSFGFCHFIPSSDGVEGRVNFRYDPILISQG